MKSAREPIFNIPPVITAILMVLFGVHAVREFFLSQESDLECLLLFAFIPARFDATVLAQGGLPGGLAADLWTFVTYALLHGDWVHLGLNAVWFLAFGSPVARRFGPRRFLVFFALTAAAGAVTHLAVHAGQLSPMIGASAAISGFMAAAIRFVFQRGGPLGFLRDYDEAAYRIPALPLRAALREPRIVIFLVVWFGLNIVFGASSIVPLGTGQAVAWEAHIGGFLAGLIMFAAFDPIAAPSHAEGDDGGTGAGTEESLR